MKNKKRKIENAMTIDYIIHNVNNNIEIAKLKVTQHQYIDFLFVLWTIQWAHTKNEGFIYYIFFAFFAFVNERTNEKNKIEKKRKEIVLNSLIR